MNFHSLKEVVEDLQAGKIVVVIDDEGRENEGDLVCAAEFVTPEIINFFIDEARSFVCVPVDQDIAKNLNLHPQVENADGLYTVPFTVTVDYKHGTTTGSSVFDRVKTIRAIADEKSVPQDFARPGHIFPLLARAGGLEERQGHTEATIELMKLAQLKPVGILSEIVNKAGEMMRGEELEAFVERHNLKWISVEKIAQEARVLA